MLYRIVSGGVGVHSGRGKTRLGAARVCLERLLPFLEGWDGSPLDESGGESPSLCDNFFDFFEDD